MIRAGIGIRIHGRLQGFLGRIREQINRLGEKIMPSELEEYLLDHPQIQQVCVVPADDEKLGQRICICLPEALSGIGLTQLRQFLKEKEIASFKMPDQVIYIGSGRIQRSIRSIAAGCVKWRKGRWRCVRTYNRSLDLSAVFDSDFCRTGEET